MSCWFGSHSCPSYTGVIGGWWWVLIGCGCGTAVASWLGQTTFCHIRLWWRSHIIWKCTKKRGVGWGGLRVVKISMLPKHTQETWLVVFGAVKLSPKCDMLRNMLKSTSCVFYGKVCAGTISSDAWKPNMSYQQSTTKLKTPSAQWYVIKTWINQAFMTTLHNQTVE